MNPGSNSTHAKFIASPFCAMVAWSTLCDQATASRLRVEELETSASGWELGVGCGLAHRLKSIVS